MGFGSGSVGLAPGTVGSVAAALAWCVLHTQLLASTISVHLLSVAVVTVLGILAIRESLRHLSEQDPGWIVIDEWAGMFLALVGANPACFSQVLVAFAVFRIFDVSKVGPVRTAERLPGALGVMLDDLVAGALTWVAVQTLVPVAHIVGLPWSGPGLWAG
jgi:phosphatidylglycerophosphatase A